MSKYTTYMMKFSQSELRGYLGQGMVDLLIEWLPNGDTLLTKQRMISMIDSIYGTSILKDKNFRKNLLQCMSTSEIIKLRDNCLTGQEKSEQDPMAVIEIIANKPWNRSSLSSYLLKIWEVSENVFDKEKDDTVVENVVESSKEQFYELLDYQYYIKQRVLTNLNSGNLLERMLIHMPTGTGKTKTCMHIITNYINFTLEEKGLVIWIAHSTELLQQAYDTFVSVWGHLGNGPIIAYKLWGNKEINDLDLQLNGVVFCGLAKLMSITESNLKLYERLKKDCRLIVFDDERVIIRTKLEKPSKIKGLALI